jgi:Glycosyl transferase family 2
MPGKAAERHAIARYDLPVSARPAICLNMIVRNEAHIVAEVLDAVAPYITSWVIVDTGSDDGTQDLIRNHMTRLAIPGELHERPWRDFSDNRSEALTLAQGHGDYIWVMDADDTVAGKPDFNRLVADIYLMRVIAGNVTLWRPQLFRDGLPVRYTGIVHEAVACDEPCSVVRLEGEYQIEARRLGARSQDPQAFARDRDLLLAQVERDPEDARSVYYLAQTYYFLSDFVNAHKWYTRRAEMGGWDEEVYFSMSQVAVSMSQLGAPWPDIQDAYLKAWEFRPIRAEPLYAIAVQHRVERRYRLGYAFARLAAEIPFPEKEELHTRPDIHAWRATHETAVCAAMIGHHAEAFTLFRQLLARPDVPEDERRRMAANRDICVPTMIDAASPYPPALAQRPAAGPRAGEVIVSLVAGPNRVGTEQTLNSFLHCCTDVSRAGRFLVVDAGLSAADRALLLRRYAFIEFCAPGPADRPDAQLAQIRGQIDGRFWLHLSQGWRFFAPDSFFTRLTGVLEAESHVLQVCINFADAAELTGACAADEAVRRTPDAGRYVLTNALASGPAMFDTERLDRAGGVDRSAVDPLAELGRRATAAGLQTASLDEVLCLPTSATPPRSTREVDSLPRGLVF